MNLKKLGPNLILCGPPCCGKTTIGKYLEQERGQFLDLDNQIEQHFFDRFGSRLSCREISHQHGMSFFRKLENETLQQCQTLTNRIIATGGGCVETSANLPLLKKMGYIIYLRADAGLLLPRILFRGLPAYLDHKNPQESLDQLLRRREPIYEALADRIIDIQGQSIEELAKQIVDHMRSYGK